MTKIADLYTDTIHDNLKPLYANWEPGRPVQLGDYGLVQRYMFIHLGNVRDLKIPFSERRDTKADRKSFSSEGGTEVKLHSKGEAYVKATLEINFDKADAVFFNAAECKHSMISDKTALGRLIMQLFRKGEWDKSWAIITDIVRAGATTVAVSSGNSSSLVLEAAADYDYIDLANASAQLTVRSERNVGFQVIAQQGLIPLIGLCKIQSAFLGFGKHFDPLSRDSTPDIVVPDDVRPEKSTRDDQLFFGQLQ